MEQKLVKVPFEVELAKRIQNKECEGRIVTRYGRNVRIICWDAHCDDNIVALIEGENGVEFTKNYVSDGMVFLTCESEYDLMLEIPEYMTFKDGDVIAFAGMEDNPTIGIFQKRIRIDAHKCYVKFDYLGYLVFDAEPLTYHNARKATESEKQKLIDALKASKEPKAKECLKILGVEVKQECEFKPFDKVLVRDEGGVWFADIFSHYTNDSDWEYKTAGGGSWEQCIPYNEQTAKLLGTTDNWEG